MNGKKLDEIFDRALDEIRDDAMPPQDERAAADRVWESLSQELAQRQSEEPVSHSIRDCSDFQALIPAYLRGGLNDAKKLLLEDHVNECLPCRKMLKQERNAHRRTRIETRPATAPSSFSTWSWRVAAAAIVAIALVGLSVQTDLFTLKTGGLIRIEQVRGEAFQVDADGTRALQAGDEVSFKDAGRIRTGKDSQVMLRLSDDSRVELDQRAELSVHERRKIWQRGQADSVIELDRGNMIVEASDQGSGHLYVDTADSLVSVTGTVFAVNTGMKGSRVSVIEGEVHVAHSGLTDVLHPGDQTTTSAELTRVSIADEIAWSSEATRHLALLAEFADIGREIEQRVEMPDARYSTELLDLAPAGTAVYVAMPNFAETLGDAYDILQERVSSNDIVRDWWDESVVASGADDEIEEVMEKIRSYGAQLGPEIALAIGADGNDENVLILAQLNRPDGFIDLLSDDLARISEEGGNESIVLLDRNFNLLAGSGDGSRTELYFWVGGEILAASSDMSTLQDLAGRIDGGALMASAGGTFHAQLADRYAEGVEWLVGVDIQSLRGDSQPTDDDAKLGFQDLQHVIVELEDQDDRTESRATIGFVRPRRGVASWLAEPAPMGSLRYVSSNAYFAAGFVMKEPATAVDELLEVMGSIDSNFESSLREFEQEHQIDVRQDIAAAIGNEFVFAIDGPVLPKPSWKFVLEVNDPSRLQATLEWAAARMNEATVESGHQGFRIETTEQRGQTYYALQSLDTGLSAHYLFTDGYLIASASRALLDRALQFDGAGLTLTTSPGFTSLMPRDSQLNFSGFMYHDFSRMLGAVGKQIAQINPETEDVFNRLGLAGGANLTLAYGDPSRITFVNTSEGGLIRSTLATFLSLDGLMSVQELVGQAVTRGSSEASTRVDDAPWNESGEVRLVNEG